MFISLLDTCKITCEEKGTHMIVAVVTDFNFGALGIGVDRWKRGKENRRNEGTKEGTIGKVCTSALESATTSTIPNVQFLSRYM